MRIISLSLDSRILNPDSISATRSVDYGKLTEKYHIIVPNSKKKEASLSDKVFVYGSGGANRVLQLFNIYRKAKELLAKEKFDCVTVQDPFEVGIIGYLLKKKYGVRLNVQEHGDFFSSKYWQQEKLLHLARYYAGIFVLKRADSIRAVSERIKKYLVRDLKIDENKIVVVPVYTETLNIEIKEKRNPGEFIFLSMGRFVRQKNLPLLIRAFALVSKKHPQAKLLLIGKGPEEEVLKKISIDLGLSGRLEFLPWTDDVKSYYAQADAYVLSSNYEGWGRVIIEAASAGLPVVMTDVGCAGEALINEKSALISPVDNIDKLAQNMMRMIEDNGLRERLIKNAFTVINRLPDKQKTLELYKKSWQAIKKVD